MSSGMHCHWRRHFEPDRLEQRLPPVVLGDRAATRERRVLVRPCGGGHLLDCECAQLFAERAQIAACEREANGRRARVS
eukprot:2350041-Prymnesium_polylepis.1